MEKKLDILRRLKAAKSESEWNRICDETKAYTRTLPERERAGDYPVWWYPEVIQSGLAFKVFP